MSCRHSWSINANLIRRLNESGRRILSATSCRAVPPPPGYLKKMLEECNEHDILFIADEVVTAFGRIGHMFASWDEFGIQPDMIVMTL